MKHVSLTPAVFHLPERVNAIAGAYAENPVVPRGPKLRPILERVRAKIRSEIGCEDSHEPVILTCSGSGAIAAALGSCVGEAGILVVSNGAYGERQARYARQMGLRTDHYALDYGVRPDLDQIEKRVRESGVDTIGLVHGATSTCSLNPVAEIGQLARRLGKTFLVDGIASLFVEEVDPSALGIDVLIASTNKGLHSNPDLAFVLVAKPLLETLAEGGGRLPYLDLGEAWRAQRDGSHPYTINVRALLELDAALDALRDEGGIAGRIATYRGRNALLREGYERLGLERFERAGMPLQNIGTALMLPEGIEYGALAEALAGDRFPHQFPHQECYEIYSAQGRLADTVFRIFNMGEYSLDTYERFLDALDTCLTKLRA